MEDSNQHVSSARCFMIFFAVVLAVITYMQRHAIAQAAPTIQEELGLTKVQMGWVFSAFLWTYALCEIPAGFAGDRWGARRVMTAIVAAWSLCTAATGLVWNLFSLMVVRGSFGVFQAGCFPNIARMFANWLPTDERVRAQGILWLSARWGGAFTPLFVLFFLHYLNWRLAFFAFGAMGIVWALFFFAWFRDDPHGHSADREEGEEADISPRGKVRTHEPIPWRKLLGSRAVLLLWGQYMCLNFGWQFYVTWLPTYLLEARKVNLEQTAWLSGLPLFFGGLGSLCCGVISPFVDRWTGNIRTSRRLLAGSGFTGAGICFALSVQIQDATWAMIALGMASFANDLVMPTSWGACMDVGGRLCGTLAGSMNMMGGLVAAAAPTVVAYLLVWTEENWSLVFYVSAGLYFLGTVFWMYLDPVTPVDAD
jgi:sugar phosphate permease